MGFRLLMTGGGVQLVPQWAQLGEYGGANGATPVKPIVKYEKSVFMVV